MMLNCARQTLRNDKMHLDSSEYITPGDSRVINMFISVCLKTNINHGDLNKRGVCECCYRKLCRFNLSE